MGVDKMVTLIFGFFLLMFGLGIVAIVLDKMEKQFKMQFDQVRKENRELKRRLSLLEYKR
ncbi:hypothetical protein [Neobacillus cucumis]|uniref:hypothetical protein n=1 Tax=Neobacillus cucumis TaxID=1740721 RepID=UPI002E22E163|nr:hypothetical protein [Neobacillus cucumis]